MTNKVVELAKKCGAQTEHGIGFTLYAFQHHELLAFYAAARREALESAKAACENEKVDAESTDDQTDYAHNAACDHCARAIRALTQGDGQ